MTLIKIPDDEYFADASMSKSELWRFHQDPDSFVIGKPRQPTESLVTGSALHCLLLEGEEEFARRYRVAPEGFHWNWDTKRFRELASFHDRSPETMLSHRQLAEIRTMADSVMEDTDCRTMLAPGTVRESALFWMWGGMKWKAKMDLVDLDRQRVVDIKTCRDIKSFPLSFWQYGYDWQAAIYTYALQDHFNLPFEFVIIAVERSGKCGVFSVSRRTIAESREKVIVAQMNYQSCVDAGEFSSRHCNLVRF